jgi:N-methylhydantoinase A
VADATLVLGYLNPSAIAGGSVRLRPDLAEAALRRDVAEPLGVDLATAADAVLRVAVVTMARAVKAVTTYRGRSPSGFDLLAFGGNGPLFAAALARELDIRRVVVPAAAGLFSSVGLLDADEARHAVQAIAAPLERLDPAAVEAALASLAERGRRDEAGRDGATDRTARFADLRFRGQSSALTLPLSDGPIGRGTLRDLGRAFVAEHERTYGYASHVEPIELVNVRVVATAGGSGEVRESVALLSGRTMERGRSGSRRAYFGHDAGWLDAPLLGRADLVAGRDGPLIVEEYDATTLVPPGARAHTDERGLIVIEVGR